MSGHPATSALISEFKAALLALNRIAAERELRSYPGGVISAVEKILAPALEEIGREWERGELSLAQVYMSSRICEQLVDQLLPPASPDRKIQPIMAVAAYMDYHLLGKRLVYASLRAGGYDVFDYGRVTAEDLVLRCREDNIELLFLSSLMLASALAIREAVDALIHAGLRVQVAVGGAPFRYDKRLVEEVGADYVGMVSTDALTIAASANRGCQ